MDPTRHTNRLINEKSPYLLQHAHNPVDWFPWGEDAFTKAVREQKPIFLSVGYSTCHWCHVMEEESFEDDAVAAILNEHFVCIKVDREERPDIDRIYMMALQAMGQGGGWPMSMFLTPGRKPFYGGTYFPPETRQGRVGFPEILRRIHEIWETERQKVDESAEGITGFLNGVSDQPLADRRPGREVLERCFNQFSRMYDATDGGFGSGPKFPRPVVFAPLLYHHARTGNPRALEMVEYSLRAMAAGGIYDHVGGGFHRYAVDSAWRVPHFEKMLYDQAQMVVAFLETFQITGDQFYAAVARDILAYVMRDMTAPDGGFYSAEDADSPKPELPDVTGEGAFYIWSKGELLGLLGDDAQVVISSFGVEDTGNAPFDPLQEFEGKNILYVAQSAARTAETHGKTTDEVLAILSRSRDLLLTRRASRPRPRLDDKILTSWNSLMISAFARAFQILGDSAYLRCAERALQFLIDRMYDGASQTLLRRFRDGEPKFGGILDDYAFMVRALLDVYECSFNLSLIERALELTHSQIDRFWDDAGGSFFDSPGNDPTLLVRLKEHYDGAEPAGNSVAASNLLRLSGMTGREDLRSKAGRVIAASAAILEEHPSAMPGMVMAHALSLEPQTEIILAGRRGDAAPLLYEIWRRYIPNKTLLLIESDDSRRILTGWMPHLGPMTMLDGKATAYVCEDHTCRLPTTEPATVGELLDKK